MGLDFKALNNFQDELAKRSEGNGVLFFQKEISKETDIRILPPYPNMNGNYFIEVPVYWINGNKYISPSVFGQPCPITDAIEEAKSSGDKDLKALLDDKENFQKKYEYLIPILLLDVKIEDSAVTDVKVKDGRARILSCGPALMKRINKVVCSRTYMNGTPDGITDRVKGHNLILSKTGEKLNTDYDAQGDVQWEMPENFYKDYPNVVEFVEEQLQPADYLEGVIRNYLYGEPMPEEPKKEKKEEKKDTSASGRAATSRATKEQTTTTRTTKEQPSRSSKTTSRTTKQETSEEVKVEQPKPTGKRNLLADLENLD